MAPNRYNISTLTRFESPVLSYLVSRVPAWVSPNVLTIFGILGALVAFGSYAGTNWSPWFAWLATVGLIMNWLGDSLDGTLARYRKMERPREGLLIDHTADLGSQVMIAVGLGLSPYVRLDMMCLALVGYLVLVSYTFIRATAMGTVRLTYFGFGPTELRLYLIVLNTFFFFAGHVTFATSFGALRLSDLLAFSAFVIQAGFFIAAITIDLRAMTGEDSTKT